MTKLSNSDNPGHGNFITTYNNFLRLVSIQKNNLWQWVKGINNPYPENFRIAMSVELFHLVTSSTSQAFNSILKLPHCLAPNNQHYCQKIA